MTNRQRGTKRESDLRRGGGFGLGIPGFFGHSDFVIRHFLTSAFPK
jgi:hypothetical protein